jgi:UDP-GlcNAc:undecaprenyl-phosphate GlcNAc-1-phosphate transferase
MILLSGFLLSLLITIALIPIASRLAVRVHAMDIPDERKVHDHPIPRSGGVAMALGVTLPVLLLAPKSPPLVAYIIGSAIIVLFGLIDDFRGMGYKSKFAAQIAAALIVVILGGVKVTSLGTLLPYNWVVPNFIAIPFTVLVIVGITNAINLSDGLDGLAGGISLLGFCCIAYLAHLEDQMVILIVALCLAGSIFGFLRFNTFPATIFMGDSGSQFLGFSAIVLCLMLTQQSTPLSPLLPLVILGFPVLDTLMVMGQRVAERRPIFSPDKNHLHHRLINLGLYHTEAVTVIYLIQAFLVTVAILLRYYPDWFLLGWYVVFASVIACFFTFAHLNQWKLRRIYLFDTVVKGRLRQLRGKRYAIRFSFGTLQYGLPAVLLANCFIPSSFPVYLTIASGLAILALILTEFFKKVWHPYILMAVLYLFTPFLMFLSVEQTASWMTIFYERLYGLSYLAVVFLVILTLKFTHRRQGFTIKPMDFLILFVAVVVPYLVSDFMQNKHIPQIATKTLVLYFGYEVLVGELRGMYGKLTWFTIIALAVIMVRGFFG